MKMQTGLLEGGVGTAVRELTTCFLAVFNRQCLSKAFLYMYHQDEEEVEAFNQAVIRGLKYGTLSPRGIGAELKPYMELAMEKGFLAPEDYEGNAFATRAVQELYPLVHAAWQRGGEEAAKKWAFQYAMEMLTNPEAVADEALLAGDMSDAEPEQDDELEEPDDAGDDEPEESEEQATECDCEFCQEMRAFDHVDLNNLHSDDPLAALMISGLRNALALSIE